LKRKEINENVKKEANKMKKKMKINENNIYYIVNVIYSSYIVKNFILYCTEDGNHKAHDC